MKKTSPFVSLHFLTSFWLTLLCFIQTPLLAANDLFLHGKYVLPLHIPSKAHVLLHADTGQVLSLRQAHRKAPPASLTKLMTLYIAFNALNEKRLHLDMPIFVSKKASASVGASSTLQPDTSYPLQRILEAIAVASGNDASVALAEHLAGSEEAFATIMNSTAQSLQMHRTHFANASGLPNKTHASSAWDLAILARRIYLEHPEKMALFSQKIFEHKGFKQANRNKLLWSDPDVKGMKTGHTEEAGFCMAILAQKNQAPMLAITLGSESEAQRTVAAKSLVSIFEKSFQHKTIASNLQTPSIPLWFGQEKQLETTLQAPITISMPHGIKLQSSMQIMREAHAPVQKGQIVGHYNLSHAGDVLTSVPIVAAQNVPQSNLFYRTLDRAYYAFTHLFSKKRS